LLRVLSVVIGGSVAVIVSSYLWPISAYKRAKIEIASAVKQLTECLLLTEPYFINDSIPAGSSSVTAVPSGGTMCETAASISVVAMPTLSEHIDFKQWLRKHFIGQISMQKPVDESLSPVQMTKSNLAEVSDLLSESFVSLRRALQMIQMIQIVPNAAASRLEKLFGKMDQVCEMLFTTLLLHMSVAMSVQACFRPPVKNLAFEKGFYGSLRVCEQNFNLRNEYCGHNVGDLEKSVKGELKHVLVLLFAWESKVWPKSRRLRFLADTAASVASNHCLLIERDVDAQIDKLTSWVGSDDVTPCSPRHKSSSSPASPKSTASSASCAPKLSCALSINDDLASFQLKPARTMVCMNSSP
jgi:hypothetical protein